MLQRLTVLALLLGIVWAPAASGAQEPPAIPEDLQRTYGACATAVVGGFACTQVLGFSQSMQWYAGRSFADRVVFNVSGADRSPQAWTAAVDSVAALIRVKIPAVREIVMQPVVGAPEGECTDVWAARNHPVIVEGIRRAADRGRITAGPSPRVAGCDQFSDALGHLTVEGAEHVRRTLREHYRPSTAGPERDRGAAAHGSAPELLRRPYSSAETGEQRKYYVYLPRGYRDTPREDWPVIFFLHGGGERGDGRGDLAWVLAHGPLYEAWIQKRDLPFVIVAPQLPVFGESRQIEGRAGHQPPRRLEEETPPRYEICALEGGGNWGEDCRIAPHRRAFDRGQNEARPIARTAAKAYERVPFFGMEFDYPPEGWPPDGWFRVEEDLVTILDDVLDTFRADPDRVYLTGISYGSFGTFDLAASHPDRWAALAPVVGTGDLDDAPVLAEAGIPVWMFGGGTDPLIKPHWLTQMARALEEAGHPHVRLTVHEDMAHDTWRRVYAGRDLYDWFLSHSPSERP